MGQRQSSHKPHRLPSRLIQDTVDSSRSSTIGTPAMHKIGRRPPSTVSYPYPRTHTTVMVLPSARPLPPSEFEQTATGTRPRPPLNRAIPPIPESKSNESIMTQNSEIVMVAIETSTPPSGLSSSMPQEPLIIENRLAQNLATKIPMVTNQQPLLNRVTNDNYINNNNNNNNNRFHSSTTIAQSRNDRNNNQRPSNESTNSNFSPPEPPRSPLIYMANSVRSRLSKIGSRLHNKTNELSRTSPSLVIKSSCSLTSIPSRKNSTGVKEGRPDQNANFDPKLFKSASMEDKTTLVTTPIDPDTQPSIATTVVTPMLRPETLIKQPEQRPKENKSSKKTSSSTHIHRTGFLLKKTSNKNENSTKRITGEVKSHNCNTKEVMIVKAKKPTTMIPQPNRLDLRSRLMQSAPLAESESSIVENSPAVEIAPTGFGIALLGASPGQRRRLILLRNSGQASRINESTTMSMGHVILPSSTASSLMESTSIITTTTQQQHQQQQALIDPFDVNVNCNNTASPSKLTSPAASSGEAQRGLIDDEIRDQPMLIGLAFPNDSEDEPLRKRWRQSAEQQQHQPLSEDYDYSSSGADDSPFHPVMVMNMNNEERLLSSVEEEFEKMTVSLCRVARSRPSRRSAGDGIESDEIRNGNPFRDSMINGHGHHTLASSSYGFPDFQTYSAVCQDAEAIKHLLLQLQAHLVVAAESDEHEGGDGVKDVENNPLKSPSKVDELISENDALRRQLFEKERVIASLRRDLAGLVPPAS